MLVQVVVGPKSLQKFEQSWKELYEADPDANHFLSWSWMSRSLARKQNWFVLIARRHRGAPAAAILPLQWKRGRLKRGTEYVDLSMAGRQSADYTGFLCLPGMEELALPALARHLKRMPWRRLRMEFLRTTAFRQNIFLEQFQQPDFEALHVPAVNGDGVDNARCPYVDLPDDWEQYLSTLSANGRQKLRRLLRTAEEQGLHVTHTDADTFEQHVDLLVEMWIRRWGQQKGERLDTIVNNLRHELADALDTGHLVLPVLWQDERPLAAFACLLDPHKRHLLFQLGARDLDFAQPAPGLVLHAHCIRWAIGQGLARYDFLRGDERYKYSFTRTERAAPTFLVKNRSSR